MITDLTFIFSSVSVLFSIVSLIIGCFALCFVIGLKNSTHQVVWRPVEPPKEDEDPFQTFEEEAQEMENPNKRIRPKAEEDEDLVDLDDPNVTSNNW